ncbi:hypothetical protein AAFF_G00160880 [Aldrovandia affinis]|uniref:Uncharacterized protein n=1 Tax=Aldrovandia affinis TaxID=143900 RepID=A0AAD7VX53_9TELE|nr:hypothetical protein AAFF_G00160880 [Aldrovandia affinis]
MSRQPWRRNRRLRPTSTRQCHLTSCQLVVGGGGRRGDRRVVLAIEQQLWSHAECLEAAEGRVDRLDTDVPVAKTVDSALGPTAGSRRETGAAVSSQHHPLI